MKIDGLKSALKGALLKKSALPKITLAGLAIVALAVVLKSTPPHQVSQHQAIEVEYINVIAQLNTPNIKGYGIVKPSTHLNSVAEVSGRIVYINPELVAGSTLLKGTLLARTDATDYQLALTQAQANVAMSQSLLVELSHNTKSIQENLNLVQEKLKFAQQELTRKQQLLSNKSISASQVDNERQKVLQLRQELVSLQQTQSILPSQKSSLEASLSSAKAAVLQQQLNIDRTEIILPFNGRISYVAIEKDQFVALGQALFTAHGMEQVEIEAQFTLEQMRPFMAVVTQTANPSTGNIIKDNHITATVKIAITPEQTWQGEVINFAQSIDPDSRTIGVLVRVDNPYQGIIPGKRPPLLDGMQASIILSGYANKTLAVPVSALQLNTLYLAASDNTLMKINATPKLIMDSVALFSEESLPSNSRVIISDIVPAINGMPLILKHNEHMQTTLNKNIQKKPEKNEQLQTALGE